MARAELLIDSRCRLGEGPIWHPMLQRLFWCDIENSALFSASAEGEVLGEWHFEDAVSASAIIDEARLLLASAYGLLLFDLANGQHLVHADLETDKPDTRTNDGRVHPSGTLWISTMNREGAAGGGTIYAFRHGRIVTLFETLSTPNAICFSPDGSLGYFADTPTGRIMSVALDSATGLPQEEPTLFADTSELDGSPDGAVVDSEGFLWNARYGAGKALRFTPDGQVVDEVVLNAPNVTCPCLGGPDLRTLFLTTAAEDKSGVGGGIFAVDVAVAGLREQPVLL